MKTKEERDALSLLHSYHYSSSKRSRWVKEHIHLLLFLQKSDVNALGSSELEADRSRLGGEYRTVSHPTPTPVRKNEKEEISFFVTVFLWTPLSCLFVCSVPHLVILISDNFHIRTLRGTNIADPAMPYIGTLTSLVSLSLENSPKISDDAFVHLAKVFTRRRRTGKEYMCTFSYSAFFFSSAFEFGNFEFVVFQHSRKWIAYFR